MSYFSFRGAISPCRAFAPLLFGFSEGQLVGRRRTRVEAHLSHCPACRVELATIVEVARVLQVQRANPAPVTTDLWERIETEIRRSPQRRPMTRLQTNLPTGSRDRSLAGLSWGQALPIASTVFAAGVLVAVLVNASQRHETTMPTVVAASAHASDDLTGRMASMKSIDPTKSLPSVVTPHSEVAATMAITIPEKRKSTSVTNLAALGRSRSRASDQARLRLASAGIARANALVRDRVSVAEARPAIQVGGTVVDASFGASGTKSSLSQQLASITTPSRLAAGSAIAVADRIYGSGSKEAETERTISRASVAFAAASHGGYAADDGPTASVSILDATGSARRQQGLFSY